MKITIKEIDRLDTLHAEFSKTVLDMLSQKAIIGTEYDKLLCWADRICPDEVAIKEDAFLSIGGSYSGFPIDKVVS